MGMETSATQAITHWAKELGGVLTLADLKVAMGTLSEVTFYRHLRAMCSAGVLVKVKRGVYATPNASLSVVSSRIEPKSYVSTGTVLAACAMIGSIPAYRVQAVKVGRPRVFTCELGTIEYLSISPRLLMGYTESGGVKMATPEKAFLDVCYFHYKGRRFSFDIETDVHRASLDTELIKNYLSHYDQRFITFYENLWNHDA